MDLWRAGVQEAAVLCGARGEETQVLLPPQEDRTHRRAQQEVRRLSLALAAGLPLLPRLRVFSACRRSVRCSLDCLHLHRDQATDREPPGAFKFFKSASCHEGPLPFDMIRPAWLVHAPDPHATARDAHFLSPTRAGARCPIARSALTTAMTERHLDSARSTEPRACTTCAAGVARWGDDTYVYDRARRGIGHSVLLARSLAGSITGRLVGVAWAPSPCVDFWRGRPLTHGKTNRLLRFLFLLSQPQANL